MPATVPAGFTPVETKSHFVEANGPFYSRDDSPDLHLGFLAEPRHCNALGIVHGGMMATIADFAMGRALARIRNNGQGLVTLNLNLDYVGAAAIGAWLEIAVQVKKQQGSIVFAVCDVRDGDKVVLTASGVFKFVAPQKP